MQQSQAEQEQPNPHQDKWRLSAQLTSERNEAFERQNAWTSLKRRLETLRSLYKNEQAETKLLQDIENLITGAQRRIDDLQPEINRCDAALEKLIPHLREQVMEGATF